MQCAMRQGKQRNIIARVGVRRDNGRALAIRSPSLTILSLFYHGDVTAGDRINFNEFTLQYSLLFVRLDFTVGSETMRTNGGELRDSQLAALCLQFAKKKKNGYDERAGKCNIYTQKKNRCSHGGAEVFAPITGDLMSFGSRAICLQKKFGVLAQIYNELFASCFFPLFISF